MTIKTQPQLCLIEDDVKLAALISTFFSNNGFQVSHFETAECFLAQPELTKYDVIVCDINLPGLNGFDICRRCRQSFDGVFVFLTAKTEDLDHISGLDLGADAYIAKPVRPAILLAKINALLRAVSRHSNTNTQRVQLPQLTIDNSARSIQVCDKKLMLATEEFDLLWILISNRNQTLNREQLFQKAVGREYDGQDRIIDGRVSRIRKKFNQIENNPYEIKTVWRKGYLFAER
ncbi:response regulator transcription factor [Thalassotalea sp. PS06]|uniref:response regulator transcription factor n=1 Tax=Thalassotalea sp. PS06 TaxID=2594005 RepID=UPI001163616B|nr:response regulator transcription factor [Thalassotalea sp. PS06]QDP01686.1 response regulator transcription factor [Thalassotalea sp. PS06]